MTQTSLSASRAQTTLAGRGSPPATHRSSPLLQQHPGVARFMRSSHGSASESKTTEAGPTPWSTEAPFHPAQESSPLQMAFPHAQSIFQHLPDISSHPRAVHDPLLCRHYGVPAFTDGLVTHFAALNPPLVVAAHEAGHQLQHQGLTHDGGWGPERHANLFAARVASQQSPRNLIGTEGSPVVSAVRPYTVISAADQLLANQWQVGSSAKVGDEGRTLTTEYKHECYADPQLIIASNRILKAKQSGVNIEPGAAGPSGLAPDGSGFKSLVEVKYEILSDEDNEEFYADCGVSAREVMGKTGADMKPRGIFSDAAGSRQETASSYDPATFRDEIYMRAGLGTDPASAHAAYNALTDKETFDQQHGINRFAAPGVGEAYTRRRDDALGGTGFNWHWGGVILVAGGDRVTFENYTKGKGYLAKDSDWYFETYGPPSKPGQTWHEQWKSVGGSGKGTTMVAATSADPSPFTTAATTLSTADLIAKFNSASNEGEKMALASELKGRWLKVSVFLKKAQEGNDDVFVEASHGGRSARTGTIAMQKGQKNTFWISLGNLFPINGKIMVKVYEEDVFANDMISILGFDSPYLPQSDNRPWDDAEYHTLVELDR